MMLPNNDFDNIVLGRRSVKVFDEEVKIPRDEMNEIIRKTTKAPSSVNMQPWRFVVVESQEAKETLRPLMRFNTRQTDTSASMVIVFGDMKNYEYGEEIYSSAVEQGFMPQEVKEELLPTVLDYYMNLTRPQMNDIVKIDCSLVAMQLMLVARSYGYDSNPIGGFDKENIAETFGLDKERYEPVVIIALGKEKVPGRESSRLPIDKVVKYV